MWHVSWSGVRKHFSSLATILRTSVHPWARFRDRMTIRVIAGVSVIWMGRFGFPRGISCIPSAD